MNGQQKRAWLILAAAILAGLGYLFLGLAINFQTALAALAILGLVGFTPLIGRGEKWDERDKAINRRAALAAGMASYLAFVLGCMGAWFVVYLGKGEQQVSVHLLPHITMLGGIVLYAVWSITILILYGRHVEPDHA